MENNDQKPTDAGGAKVVGTVIPPQQTAPLQQAVPPQQTAQPVDTSAPAETVVSVDQGMDREPVGISVSWSASEFVDHQKGFGWFFMLIVLVIILAGGVFLLLHSIFSAVIILLIGLAFGIAAGRRPRVLDYMVDGEGVTVGQKIYSYANLKSFSVISSGGLTSILLIPLKRFSPPVTVYYEAKDEEEIIDIIGDHLPQEDASKDYVEMLMRRMRF